ncbi:sensor histidine kinase [Olivibacter sitiensis]|uniref:sensor histidine kinase n=1 Tax=Olivibacter sitiensis TaxID=376470 RepID=UPI00146FC843|nr:histidine kinase [Olivibacter sitiensis]
MLVLFQTLLFAFVFFISYISDPDKAISEFGKRHGIGINLLLLTLEGVFVYYILIFCAILPFMRKSNRKYTFAIVGLLFIEKISLAYWDFATTSQEETTALSNSVIAQTSIYWFLLWGTIFYVFDLIICFSAAVMIEWIRKSKQQIILEKQKAEAELNALKHQINPHFLFNSLSFIYGKTIKLDEDTAQSVLILADIMRYALGKEEDADGKVMIDKEVTHMKNVIEINQMRHNNSLNIIYNEHIVNPSATIVPLVLITLVENAFKHGDLQDRNHPLVINLNTNAQQLSFYIENKKGQGVKELSNGIGLQNVEQRLRLMYGDNYTLLLKDEQLSFSVLLKIPLY